MSNPAKAMKIAFQSENDLQKFIDFNSDSFPERGAINQKLIDFRYRNPLNPNANATGNVLAFDENNQLIGQAMYHKADYFFANERRQTEWGFDFFVVPERRNDFIGIHILEYVKTKPHAVFATGLGEKALKLQKLLGYHILGHLKKYIKITNPLLLPMGFLRSENIQAKSFPACVGKGDSAFERVSINQLWNSDKPYNASLLEFARDREFLQWRFYSAGFDYAVYKQTSGSGQPVYFAVRAVKIKHITSLVLVDYRFDITKPEEFGNIVNAVKKVATRLWLPVVVTGSSLKAADSVLESLQFKVVGRDRPIVSNDKQFKMAKDQIAARDFVFSTLADSDGEYLM